MQKQKEKTKIANSPKSYSEALFFFVFFFVFHRKFVVLGDICCFFFSSFMHKRGAGAGETPNRNLFVFFKNFINSFFAYGIYKKKYYYFFLIQMRRLLLAQTKIRSYFCFCGLSSGKQSRLSLRLSLTLTLTFTCEHGASATHGCVVALTCLTSPFFNVGRAVEKLYGYREA